MPFKKTTVEQANKDYAKALAKVKKPVMYLEYTSVLALVGEIFGEDELFDEFQSRLYECPVYVEDTTNKQAVEDLIEKLGKRKEAHRYHENGPMWTIERREPDINPGRITCASGTLSQEEREDV